MSLGTGGDSSAPHCLLTLRATLTRCPIGLTARFACALTGPSTALPIYELRITNYDLESSRAVGAGYAMRKHWWWVKSRASVTRKASGVTPCHLSGFASIVHRPSSIVHELNYELDASAPSAREFLNRKSYRAIKKGCFSSTLRKQI